ncbi:hypothetical protein [Brachybacterium sp. P6-10-X1]|uniref:hypothetical protein n=1 Tax=Brachybacterium sp. P6-10-X1 TaxID=1903186 RepID=UPI0012F95804|nr:hypothetical protein [Brachybacterium sp. P6-10-X1]
MSSIQAIEEGRAAPTLPSLLTLALVLGELRGRPLTLVDLLGPAEAFEKPAVGDQGRPIPRAVVERALRGEPVEVAGEDRALLLDARIQGGEPFGRPGDPADGLSAERLSRVDLAIESAVHGRGGAPLTDEEMSDALDELVEQSQQPPEPDGGEATSLPPSLAEARAARKLEIAPEELQYLARALWEQGLEAEAAERAGERSTPQARGRVTRVLVAELREAIEAGI